MPHPNGDTYVNANRTHDDYSHSDPHGHPPQHHYADTDSYAYSSSVPTSGALGL